LPVVFTPFLHTLRLQIRGRKKGKEKKKGVGEKPLFSRFRIVGKKRRGGLTTLMLAST